MQSLCWEHTKNHRTNFWKGSKEAISKLVQTSLKNSGDGKGLQARDEVGWGGVEGGASKMPRPNKYLI